MGAYWDAFSLKPACPDDYELAEIESFPRPAAVFFLPELLVLHGSCAVREWGSGTKHNRAAGRTGRKRLGTGRDLGEFFGNTHRAKLLCDGAPCGRFGR